MNARNTLLLSGLFLASTAGTAMADPLSGQELKFIQRPMLQTDINGQVYSGHDELSTLYAAPSATGLVNYSGIAMADDFADPITTPVVHVRWWGGYLNNSMNPNLPVNEFLIAFESDVPADQSAGGFSHPGEVLSSQIVRRGALSPGSGTFTENLILDLPGQDRDIYEYNAELHLGKEFPQKPETVYWLKIAALVEEDPFGAQPVQWGWHNRDYTVTNPFAAAVTPPIAPGERDARLEVGIPYPTEVWHFQDDAVSAQTSLVVDPMMPTMPLELIQQGYEPQNYLADLDGPGVFDTPDGISYEGIGRFSKDLAFELYTIPIPEPGTGILVLLGVAAALTSRRR